MQESRLKERLQYLKSIAQTEIFTNWELLTFLALFMVLGYIFFPKGKIEKLLSSPKDTNYELSKIYLEKLLKIEPKPQLIFLLVEREAGLGHYKEALRILDRYRRFLLKSGKERAYLKLKYTLLKRLYFSEKSKEDKNRLKTEIEKVLEELLSKGTLKDKKFVYREALNMDMPEVALKAAEEIALETGEKDWYKRSLNLAVALKNWKEALQIVNLMAEKDPKFLKEGLLISQASEDRKSFERFAQKLIESGKFSLKDLQSVVYFELSQKNYKEAEKFCSEAIKRKRDRRTVKFCLNVALWTKDYRRVREIIKENLNRFRNDKEMLEEFLRVARMANDSKLQLEVADRLFQLINGDN